MNELLVKHKLFFPEIPFLYDYQSSVINMLQKGGNALAIIPTGGGKSLLYQLMALELEGITIVVSPLIALMNEQVGDLNHRGIKAIALNYSNYQLLEQRQILRGLGQSDVKLLYIAPERLQNPFFRAALIASEVTVSMVVVDEAHCISQWGNGFRPDYDQIPGFVSFLKSNGHQPQILCLTATLALAARTEIAEAFEITPDSTFVSPDVLRRNLDLNFEKVDLEEDKEQRLRAFLDRFKPNKTIAYLYSKLLTRRYAEKFHDDFATGYYNADIEPEERNDVYQDFVTGNIELLFATTAFGMGINIPNIESVIHIHIPNSIEEYYQQVGRGWRRKNPVKVCHCLALWSEKNFKERKRELSKQKYSTDHIREAYRLLTGSAEITSVGQIVNKSKDTLLGGKEYNLQLLKHKLEKHKVIETLGELNGSPETIVLHKQTPFWQDVQDAAAEGMDSFSYVSEALGISMQRIIDHLYEQDLKNNIKKLPAMQKDVYFEICMLEIPDNILEQIRKEINDGIDYQIMQLEALEELFNSENAQDILAKSLG